MRSVCPYVLQGAVKFAVLFVTTFVAVAVVQAAVLVKDHQPQARIVVADDAPASVRFAASELQSYLQKSTGAVLPIGGTPAADEGVVNIYLGDSPQARAAGFDVSTLVADGSMRGVVDGDLFILGRDQPCAGGDWNAKLPAVDALWTEHGTLNGVYDLLEEAAGVRWYLPGEIGEVVPAHATIEVADAHQKDEPVFTDRWFTAANIFYYYQKDNQQWPDAPDYVSDEQDVYKWLMRLRWSTQVVVRGSHSTHYLDYAERFGASHPEWFALQSNGERAIDTPRGAYLCWSQPGLVQEMTLDAKAFYSGEPASARGIRSWNTNRFGQYFMLDPHDGYPGCQSELCQKVLAEHPQSGYSEIMFGVIAQVADAVKDSPNARITTLAYPPKLLPPKTVKLPENVSVRLCIAGPNAVLRPLANERQMQLMKQWSERLDGELVLWTYANAPGYLHNIFGGSVQTLPHAIATFLRESRPYIEGMYYQNNQTTQTNRNLDTYVAMRLMWNPDQDVDQLLAEYFKNLYGPGGDAVGRFYQRLETQWDKIVNFYPEPKDELDWYDRQPVSIGRVELWEKILTAEELDQLDKLLKEAETAVAGDPVYAKRVALLRQWTYGTMLSYRGKFLQELGAKDRASMIVHRASTSADADGVLPASAWSKVAWQPMASVSPRHETNVKGRFRVLFDDQYLYFYADLEEPLMDRSATAADRAADDSNIWKDNDVELMIDPHNASGSTYQLMINDRGQLADLQCKNGQYDYQWSSQAKLHVAQIDAGWSVQFAMPLEAIGLKPGAGQPTIGFNVVRHRSIHEQADEFYGWCPLAKLGRWNDPILWGAATFEESESEGRNLISNGGMEAAGDPKKGMAIADWNPGKTGKDFVSLDNQVKASGKNAACIRHDTINSTALLQYLPKLKPNTRYRLRCKVKLQDVQGDTPDNVNSGVYLQFYAPGFNKFTPIPALRGDQDWRTIETTVTTAPTFPAEPVCYLRLWLRNASGAAWFDDVSITEVR